MDSRMNILNAAFDHQRGEGFNFQVFHGRSQYGAGFGDVLRGIWRVFRPVAMKGAQTLLRLVAKLSITKPQ